MTSEPMHASESVDECSYIITGNYERQKRNKEEKRNKAKGTKKRKKEEQEKK
jgi:hypothetical protein